MINTQQKATAIPFSVVAGRVKKPATLSSEKVDSGFNFDLERMTKAVNAKSHTIPDEINNFDEFDAWINQL